MTKPYQHYSLAFIFNKDHSKVLLMMKNRPEWQKGRVNGIGGKFEEGETGLQCVAREIEEETALVIPHKEWIYIGKMKFSYGLAEVFTTTYESPESDARQTTDEAIGWFPVDALPNNCIENLLVLIPFAKLKAEGTYPPLMTLTYPES